MNEEAEDENEDENEDEDDGCRRDCAPATDYRLFRPAISPARRHDPRLPPGGAAIHRGP